MAKKEMTPEQLAKLGRPRMERAIEHVENGDRENAIKEIKGMFGEFQSMHDILRDWIAAIYSYVYQQDGDQALYDLNKAACSFWLEGLMKLYPSAEPQRKAQMLAAGFRGHLVPLSVEEDDEKFTLQMLPCGSGGRLRTSGGYDPPKNLALVKKAQPMTFFKENFPVYCTHCAFQEIIPIETLGYPMFITDCPDGDKIGVEPCRVYIYKDHRDIPEKFYERVGKKKPENT